MAKRGTGNSKRGTGDNKRGTGENKRDKVDTDEGLNKSNPNSKTTTKKAINPELETERNEG